MRALVFFPLLYAARWHPFTNTYMLGPLVVLGAAVGSMGLTVRKRLDDQLRER